MAALREAVLPRQSRFAAGGSGDVVALALTARQPAPRADEPDVNDGGDRAWDFAPAAVAVAAGTIAIGYVKLMDAEGDSPRAWFLGGLLVASALAGYGAVQSAPRRAEAIATSGVVLMSLGMLAIASIGLPILIAGVVAIACALESRDEGATS